MDLTLTNLGPFFPRSSTTTSGGRGAGTGGGGSDNEGDFESRRRDIDRTPPLCAICIDGGQLIICDGPCHRSFHLECLGMTEKQVP